METGDFHTPYGRWLRTMHANARDGKHAESVNDMISSTNASVVKTQNPQDKQPFHCPYEDTVHAFGTVSKLMRHIKKVIDSKGGADRQEEHERICDDGWNDGPTWRGVPSVNSQRDNVKRKAKVLKESGVTMEPLNVWSPFEPWPGQPGLFRGDITGQPMAVIPPEIASTIRWGPRPDGQIHDDIPQHVKSTITWGGPSPAISDYIGSTITWGSAGASEKDDEG